MEQCHILFLILFSALLQWCNVCSKSTSFSPQQYWLIFEVPPPSTHQARKLDDAALATRIKELAEKDQYFLVNGINLFLWGFVTHELSPSLHPSLRPSLPPLTHIHVSSLAKKWQMCVCIEERGWKMGKQGAYVPSPPPNVYMYIFYPWNVVLTCI